MNKSHVNCWQYDCFVRIALFGMFVVVVFRFSISFIVDDNGVTIQIGQT